MKILQKNVFPFFNNSHNHNNMWLYDCLLLGENLLHFLSLPSTGSERRIVGEQNNEEGKTCRHYFSCYCKISGRKFTKQM